MEELITCINCPVGCRMKVMISDDRQVIGVEGNNCPRGEKYAKQECTMPLRMITAVIPVENFDTPLSVKTANPIPKKLIPNVMEELKKGILVNTKNDDKNHIEFTGYREPLWYM